MISFFLHGFEFVYVQSFSFPFSFIFWFIFIYYYIDSCLHVKRDTSYLAQNAYKIILSLHTIMMNYWETQVNGNFFGDTMSVPWYSQAYLGIPGCAPGTPKYVLDNPKTFQGSPKSYLGLPLHLWVSHVYTSG